MAKTPTPLPANDLARYDEDVLNAGWLPQPLEATPAPVVAAHQNPLATDLDAFLARVYRTQE
jgi:hypothetical protein